MFIALSLEDEATYEEAAANACNVTRRHADQDVHDILRRQIWDGRRPDVLDADLVPDKLTQFSDQLQEALSPFDRTTLDKLHTFAIHLAIMSSPDFTKQNDIAACRTATRPFRGRGDASSAVWG